MRPSPPKINEQIAFPFCSRRFPPPFLTAFSPYSLFLFLFYKMPISILICQNQNRAALRILYDRHIRKTLLKQTQMSKCVVFCAIMCF